jgi:hypothetical protein
MKASKIFKGKKSIMVNWEPDVAAYEPAGF